jgi:DNA-binding winged helix-turn-helix (wHTH) protein
MPMPPSNREAGLLRFGVFEVDLAAGELRKNGVRIRLQEQPFQVLAALLQNAGQVVTRDDLRERIWPADTFVDFDHSLNTAVNKIRESLGDSASSPRFVETLARRGYRFIAPVDHIATPPAAVVPAQGNSTRAGVSAPHWLNDPAMPAADIALHPELHLPVPRRGLVRALFALIQIMYLSFYLSGLSRLHDVDRVASELSPGLESTVDRGRGPGHGSGGDSAEVLPLVRSRFRFPQTGWEIRPAIPIRPGTRSTVGHRAVPAAAADRRRPGIRRDCRFALRAFFRENPGEDGV